MEMTSREIVRATLRGDPTPRVPTGPLAVHVTAALAGISIEDYTLDPVVMADCVCRYHERFRPDAVWLSADTWVTAEAMGAEVAFPGNGQPMAGTGAIRIRELADLDRLPSPSPHSSGRMPLMLEAMRLVRERLGDAVFIVGCFDQAPFSLACALAGINELMMRLAMDAGFVNALIRRCADHAAAYAIALAEAGADMLSAGDAPAGLIGRERYRQFALPAEQELFRVIRAAVNLPTSLHICGNAKHILPDMANAGADVLEIDHHVSLEEACQLTPHEIALWGNLDPVGSIQQGTSEDIRARAAHAADVARRSGRRRFVLSSGCTLAPDTPPENIAALTGHLRPAAS